MSQIKAGKRRPAVFAAVRILVKRPQAHLIRMPQPVSDTFRGTVCTLAHERAREIIMDRRDFMLKAASIAATGIAVSSCTTGGTVTGPAEKAGGGANRRREIETGAEAALQRLQSTVQGSGELLSKASGVLIFPRVLAAGLIVGGEHGDGVLRVRGASQGYYTLTSVSVGLQVGAQSKSIIFLFMTQEALDKFRGKPNWAVGIDASVALLKVGANGVLEAIPTATPVAAFVLTNAGLMANLSLEGTRIAPLKI
jgi:lipid-binding SYLF domain-containing protein